MTTHDGKANQELPQVHRTLSRRNFLRAVSGSAGAALLAACGVTTAQPGGANTGAATSAAGGAPAAGGTTVVAPAAGGTAKTTLEFWAFSEDRLKFVRELVKSSAW